MRLGWIISWPDTIHQHKVGLILQMSLLVDLTNCFRLRMWRRLILRSMRTLETFGP